MELQSNNPQDRLSYEIEQFLLANGAQQFLHLFLRLVTDRIKSGEIILILAPIDAALQRLANASGKTIEKITSIQEGLDILANHVSVIPLNKSNNGQAVYIAINDTSFGKKVDDLNLLNFTKFAQFGNVMVETIDKIITAPGQLDRLRSVNSVIVSTQQQNTNTAYDRFPRDVIRIIALNLLPAEIRANCLTSRRFNQVICNDEVFWLEKLRKDYPKIYEGKQVAISGTWRNTYESLSNKLFITGDLSYAFRSPKVYSQYHTFNRIPRRIPNIEHVTALATGLSHVALIANGKLYTFGMGDKGQLGLGDIVYTDRPMKVQDSNSKHVTYSSVSCGHNHTTAISDGRLCTFGAGTAGQLGHGDYMPKFFPTYTSYIGNVTQVACSSFRTLFIANKKVYTCGSPTGGQTDANNSPSLFSDSNITDVTFIAAGLGTTALLNRGVLYTYRGYFNVKSKVTIAPVVHDLPGISFVACGHGSVMVIANEKLYAYGDNTVGQLGLGDTNPRDVLTNVFGPERVTHIACGNRHTAIVAGGQAYTCGSADEGKLGLGDTPTGVIMGNYVYVLVPTLVDGFESVSTVACSDDRTCIVGVSRPGLQATVEMTEEEAKSKPLISMRTNSLFNENKPFVPSDPIVIRAPIGSMQFSIREAPL